MKKISLMILLIISLLVIIHISNNVHAEAKCPEGQNYSSYWRSCQNICNSFQEWDSKTKSCINKIEMQEQKRKNITFKECLARPKDNTIKGNIENYTGKVIIERGLDIIKPGYKEPLMTGDTVVVDDNANATIILIEGKTIEIKKKTKFTIPSAENAFLRTFNRFSFFISCSMNYVDRKINKNKFEIEKTTVVAGARA
jgi:hypothetical protein